MGPFTTLIKAAGGVRLATLLLALWKLFKHPDTPWAPKVVAIAVLAYVLSPIDLLPDFIPIIGQLDELLLVPLGVALVVRLTPKPLWQARLAGAQASAGALPRLVWGAAVVLLLWGLLLGGLVWWLVSASAAGSA